MRTDVPPSLRLVYRDPWGCGQLASKIVHALSLTFFMQPSREVYITRLCDTLWLAVCYRKDAYSFVAVVIGCRQRRNRRGRIRPLSRLMGKKFRERIWLRAGVKS